MSASVELELLVAPPRIAPIVRRVLLLASAIVLAELVVRQADTTAGAVLLAVVFIVLVNAAAYRAHQLDDVGALTVRLLLAASLLPLARLLMLSAPVVPWLRVDPRGLWAFPLIVAAALALWQLVPKAHRIPVLASRGTLRRPLAVALSGLPLGLAAYVLGTNLPGSVAFRPRTATWVGVGLVVVAALAEELLVRGVIQPIAVDAFGPSGLTVTVLLSTYLWTGWLGPTAAAPVLLASGLFTWSAARSQCLYGGLLGRVLLLVSLVTLWPAVLE